MDFLPIVVAVIFLSLVVIVGSMLLSKDKGVKNKKGKRIRARDHAQVLKEANRRLAQNPKDPEALLAIGEVYYAEQ